jgi:hypothetical protein
VSKEVRFAVTPDEMGEIEAYVRSKKKWKRTSDFARYAVFQTMEYSKAGGHRKVRADPSAPRLGGNEGKEV